MKNKFDLSSYLAAKKKVVDDALRMHLDGFRNQSTALADAMRYSVEAGGKRLRPILCLAACEAVCGKDHDAMAAACALECIHTYSLIHDDLPAMDDDDLRRGKATCHKAYNEATAILAGDALLTMAFEILASCCSEGQDPRDILRVIVVIASAAGAQGMVLGQMLDLNLEGKPVSWEEAEQMHVSKTGALIAASLEVGAIMGGGTQIEISALRAFGKNIGLAFQVADDILNVEGETALLGKPVGRDQELEKATAPAILGLDSAKRYARELVNGAVEHLNGFSGNTMPLVALARYIIERKN